MAITSNNKDKENKLWEHYNLLHKSIENFEYEKIIEKIETEKNYLDKTISKLKNILDISQHILTSPNLNWLIEKFRKLTPELCSCWESALFNIVTDKWQKFLQFKNITGQAWEKIKSILIPTNDKSIAWSCAKWGKAEVINNVRWDPRFNNTFDKKSWIKTENMIVVPIKVKKPNSDKEEIVGVLQSINKKNNWKLIDFNENDLYYLSTYSIQIWIAMQIIMERDHIKNDREKIKSNNEKIKKIMIGISTSMIWNLGSKDGYTAWHSKNVTHYSASIWKQLWLNDDDIQQLKLSAILHDYWKTKISTELIDFNWRYSKEQMNEMKHHTTYWWKELDLIDENIAKWAWEHHENIDWSWYPRGLKWDKISLIWKIIAVADVFDALTSKRSYKEEWPLEKTIRVMAEDKDKKFDPIVFDAFWECIENKTIDPDNRPSNKRVIPTKAKL